MTVDKNKRLVRHTDNKIEVTIEGTPADEWLGIDGADVWWVLTDDEDGGNVLLEKHSDDAGFNIEEVGGGETDAVVEINLEPADTETLPRQVYQEIVVQDADGDISQDNLDPHRLFVRESSADEVTSP